MLGSLFKLLKAVIKNIFKFVWKIIKALLPLLLIVAAIYLAPFAATALASAGGPTWLVSAFSAIGSVAPAITSAVSWIGSGLAAVGSAGWSAFASASLSTQASIVFGAAALIAPEETSEFVEEVATFVVDTVTGVGGVVASAFFSSPIGLLLIGGAAYLLLRSNNDGPSEVN